MIDSLPPCTVAIIGGGTSGLALASELKARGVGDVVVIERESAAGGVPRHCGHYPFGVVEFKRLLKGPAYAEKLVNIARDAGINILLGTTVTALHKEGLLTLTDTHGQHRLQAGRVVLCTGICESTRAQRMISGDRPQGVLSTGALQSMVYLHRKIPFQSPVILGTELVSLSSLLTCNRVGIKPIAMLEENLQVTVPPIMRAYPMIKRIPVHTGIRDIRIEGSACVDKIRFVDADGNQRSIQTDGVIVSGQFRPESALVKTSHLRMDVASGGPMIDQHYRASDPAYYCTGNVLRPVENSAWCWKEGKQTAAEIASELMAPKPRSDLNRAIDIKLDHAALKWVVPQCISTTTKPSEMKHMQLRVRQPVTGRLVARVKNEILWSGKVKALPERRILMPIYPFVDYANRSDRAGSIILTVETND